MESLAPPSLSGLAKLLLRRPPSLRDLVTLAGHAGDYAWFAALVRRLFPQEAEAVLAAPDVRQRVERFAQIFQERHFPLYAPFFDYYMEDGDEPPWTWLRRGIPFELMGFGYDGLHEMWDGYRDGLSALALLAKTPDSFYEEPDGLRVAWLESAAVRIPQADPAPHPRRRHTAGRPHGGAARGPGSRASAQACSWVWSRDRQLLPRCHCYEDGDVRRDSPTPGTTTLSRRAPRSGGKASAVMDSVSRLAGWLEDDLPGRFAGMLDLVLERLPDTRTGGQRT